MGKVYKLHPLLLSMVIQSIKCDQKGRIYLKQAIRARYGDKFVVVDLPDGVLLRPVPRDPVADLAERGRPIRGMSLRQLRAAIRKQA